jgi:protein-S-isoprenylcysteine O-methyltransferase Ste14
MHWGRAYFGLQALAGAIWWVGVATLPWVRTATLGSLDLVVVGAFDIPLFVICSVLAAAGSRWAAWIATAWTAFVTLGLATFATITGEAGWGVLAMIAATVGSAAALALVELARIPTEWLARGPFRFRVASAGRGPSARMLATAGQIVVFWGGALVVVPAVIRFAEERWGLTVFFTPALVVLGGALLIPASALGLWSAVAMSVQGDGTPLPIATANRLVVVGPYRFVRNPMAVAGISQGVAVGLVMSSWLVIVYALLGSLVWNYAIRPLEEADLSARFGDDFERYRSRVRCWIPGRPAPRPALSSDSHRMPTV